MDSIDEIKRARRAQLALMRRKQKEAQDKLDLLVAEDGEIFVNVNGDAAEVREECRIARGKLRIRKVD